VNLRALGFLADRRQAMLHLDDWCLRFPGLLEVCQEPCQNPLAIAKTLLQAGQTRLFLIEVAFLLINRLFGVICFLTGGGRLEAQPFKLILASEK